MTPAASLLAVTLVLGATAQAQAQTQAQTQTLATRCAALATPAPSGLRLTAAVVAAAPSWSPAPVAAAAAQPAAPFAPKPFAVSAPFCRVQGTIDPDIGFELWLPDPARWNARLLGAGVGGDAGVFNYQDLPTALARGYAAATTDTGHKAADRTWMLGPKARLEAFEHIAEHRLAQVSQMLVQRFYGHAAAHRYFLGCSGGGRQALKEMQDYPGDYDGIIAGAPGPQTSEMTTRRMWELLLREHNPGVMSPADWQHVVDAAVAQCDPQDGVRDGVIADPRSCRFDIGRLRCPAAATTGFCLSEPQLKLVETIYAPLRDSHGHALDDGILPGVLVDSGHSRLAPATFGQAVRHQPDWAGDGFDVTQDYAAIRRTLPDLDADNADVAPFVQGGGKAIIYQGLNDPAVAARMTIAYYERVSARLGPAVRRAMRLFLVPGMNHCMGGSGADRFGGSGAAAPSTDADHDLLAALDRWVSSGVAPDQVIASKVVNGTVTETRPICAYPAQARYVGGDANSATAFKCGGH